MTSRVYAPASVYTRSKHCWRKSFHIERFDPLTDFDDIKAMLAGEDDVWRRFTHAVGNGLECARVARYDDKIAGYLTVTRQSARHVEVAVYVDAPYRRRGVGSQLLLSADRYMLNSAYEHARCVFAADEGAAEFLSRNGYRLYCPVYDMERGAYPIDGGRLGDAALNKRDIRIRPYQDADYMAWHTISDVAFYLLREKLDLVPAYYQPPSEYERRRLNNRRDTYIMEADGVPAAVGAIRDHSVQLLAVRPDLQRRGYGRMMAAYLNNKIVSGRRAHRVTLSVPKGSPAKSLFESLGFYPVRYAYMYIKYYKPESRPKAPKGYKSAEEIIRALKKHGTLFEELEP